MTKKLLHLIQQDSSRKEAARVGQEWLETCTISLTQDYTARLPRFTQLPPELGERAARELETLLISPETISQLLLQTAIRMGKSHPMAAYQAMNRAFEVYPEISSKLDLKHPGYRFDPGLLAVVDKCPICGGEGEPYFNAFSYQMNTFSAPFPPAKLWMKCAGCGDLYTYSFPRSYLTPGGGVQKVQPRPFAPGTEPSCKEVPLGLSVWCGILHSIAAYTAGRDILEVGVGRGALIATALEMGYQVESVELDPDVCQEIADLLQAEIWNCDFLAYQPEKTYSILIMGDVIEHVTDPGAALRKAHSLLRDGGVLWLSTPNRESSWSRLTRWNDAMWKEPYHISYFSRQGLERLLEECGFTVLRYDVSSRYNGSMELLLQKKQES